jgi:hypothetical protein
MPVKDHYDQFLAQFYSWMIGDYESRVKSHIRFFKDAGLTENNGIAIDLGAGHGIQSMALSETHSMVHAVDFCQSLLEDLDSRKSASIETHCSDILAFLRQFNARANTIVCMGDTLTHLNSAADVFEMLRLSSNKLAAGGKLIIAYRDLSTELTGANRFLPVKSDSHTVMTCFLEYFPDVVKVHDIIHTRTEERWTQKISWYPKLRLPVDLVQKAIRQNQFSLTLTQEISGMTYLVAVRD